MLKNKICRIKYIKAFRKLTSMLGIPSDNCVITKMNFNDKTNSIDCKYSCDTERITIPAGKMLFHKTIAKIKGNELKPTFRSNTYGYLYSSKRVYFSIHNNMPNITADLPTGKKTLLYTPKETIRSAFVDPLLPSYQLGAVFVDTDYPISVKQVNVEKEKKKEQKNAVKESVASDIITLDEAAFLLDCLK